MLSQAIVSFAVIFVDITIYIRHYSGNSVRSINLFKSTRKQITSDQSSKTWNMTLQSTQQQSRQTKKLKLQYQPRNMKYILKKLIDNKREEEVEQQPWVGQYVTNQWHYEDLEKESYNINNIWKNIPDVFFSRHTALVFSSS